MIGTLDDWAQQLQARFAEVAALQIKRGGSRLGLRISESGLEVRWPRGIAERDLLDFLGQHQAWLATHLDRRRGHDLRLASAWRLSGDTAAQVQVWGQAQTVIWSSARSALGDGQVFLAIDPEHPQAAERARRVLARLLVESIEQRTCSALRTFSVQMNASAGRTRLKVMRSRWGSLAPDGAMSLNLALVFAPPATLDYVIVHELAHVHERNHSPRFWTHVARACPQFSHERARLKRDGALYLALAGKAFRYSP